MIIKTDDLHKDRNTKASFQIVLHSKETEMFSVDGRLGLHFVENVVSYNVYALK